MAPWAQAAPKQPKAAPQPLPWLPPQAAAKRILYFQPPGIFPFRKAISGQFWDADERAYMVCAAFPRVQEAQAEGHSTTERILEVYNRPVPFPLPLVQLLDAMLTINEAARATLDDVAAAAWLPQEGGGGGGGGERGLPK